MIAVELQDVVKRFGSVTAVDALSFSVRTGQCVSLLGPSGCGKTTTLRLIAGFEAPDHGTVRIGGRDMAGRRPYERKVGLVFQDYALFPHMTVEENVAYGMRQRGVVRGEIPGRVRKRLEQVRLAGFERRRPSQLSGGEQQRVALARALATEPDVLLLDEPLSNLDAKLRQELRLELKALLRSVGTTTIVVTHDQEEAITLSEHVIIVNRGRIEQQGSPARSTDNRATGSWPSSWVARTGSPDSSPGGWPGALALRERGEDGLHRCSRRGAGGPGGRRGGEAGADHGRAGLVGRRDWLGQPVDGGGQHRRVPGSRPPSLGTTSIRRAGPGRREERWATARLRGNGCEDPIRARRLHRATGLAG